MDDEAGGLVYDGEEFVLKNDIKRNVLGLELSSENLGKFHLDLIALADLVGWFGWTAVDENVFVIDQPLEP